MILLVALDEVGQISGRKQDRVALAVGARDLALEVAVEPEIATEQPRIAVADPVELDAANGGCPRARTGRDAEIVVGAEREPRLVFDLECGAWETVYDQRNVRRLPAKPICQFHEFIHATHLPHFRSDNSREAQRVREMAALSSASIDEGCPVRRANRSS